MAAVPITNSKLSMSEEDIPPELSISGQQVSIDEKKPVSLLLCLIVAVFGVGSWIDINGLWVQMPLMVPSLPEGWALPAYFIIAIQVANIGPFLYVLASHCMGDRIKESPVIYAILGLGGLSCLTLSFVWHRTVTIGSSEHSVPLIVLVLCLALVDCTSSVTFLPFMAAFPPIYMSALYVGEGCSGLLPALVALVQGVGHGQMCHNVTQTDANGTNHTSLQPLPLDPRFSVSAFMGFLCSMLVLSLVAFFILDRVPRDTLLDLSCSRCPPRSRSSSEQNSADNRMLSFRRDDSYNATLDSQYLESTVEIVNTLHMKNDRRFFSLMFFILIMNLLTNGLLPSLQSYSALPYGITTYHLTAALTNIVNPLACFLTFPLRVRSIPACLALVVPGCLLAVYIIVLASHSPTPPLHDSALGGLLQLGAWVCLTGLFSFTKASIAIEMRLSSRSHLRWCGAVTQLGSIFGAIISFVLVNVLHLFKDAPMCHSTDVLTL